MKKVLVVDDDLDILEAVHLILESGGYISEVTAKGNEVHGLVNDFKPDLIILDVLLSGKDGRNICSTLKSDKKTKNIPILMISAHPLAKRSIQACGADSFVAKPFSVAQFLQEVEKVI